MSDLTPMPKARLPRQCAWPRALGVHGVATLLAHAQPTAGGEKGTVVRRQLKSNITTYLQSLKTASCPCTQRIATIRPANKLSDF